MKVKLYVELKQRKGSYVTIQGTILENEIEVTYNNMLDFSKQFNNDKAEILEGFKLKYLLLDIKIDGRKKKVSESDIYKTMEQEGLTTRAGESMFGNYHLPTDKLNSLLDAQKQQRQDLINNGEYVLLKNAM